MSYAIITPGRKWIKAAKNIASTDTQGDSSVSGFYKRLQGGITFFDLAGIPFAFLVTNRYRERFFVTCSVTSSGIHYMFSTDVIVEQKLGIDHLGFADQRSLAHSIVEDMGLHAAVEILASANVTVEDVASMANNRIVSEAHRLASAKAGLLESLGDETYLTSTGRIYLKRNGYGETAAGWVQIEAVAA